MAEVARWRAPANLLRLAQMRAQNCHAEVRLVENMKRQGLSERRIQVGRLVCEACKQTLTIAGGVASSPVHRGKE
jgi:hypothetical protein